MEYLKWIYVLSGCISALGFMYWCTLHEDEADEYFSSTLFAVLFISLVPIINTLGALWTLRRIHWEAKH